MLLLCTAVGVLAGAVTVLGRMHLGLPGHKALLWMIPILAARLLTGAKLGTTAGAATAVTTSLAAGGNLAGGPAMMPLVVLAGALLDVAAAFAEKHALTPVLLVSLMGLAGLAANLICLAKRFFSPVAQARHALWGIPGMGHALSYALFGLIAGLIGAGIACALLRRSRHDRSD